MPVLSKRGLYAIASRYGWPLHRTPSPCACVTVFSVDRALSCPKGYLPSLCHSEIGDLIARLLTEVCHQVQVEPVNSPGSFSLSKANTQESARLDIALNGFWGWGVGLNAVLWMLEF